jgi:hypothetical protein
MVMSIKIHKVSQFSCQTSKHLVLDNVIYMIGICVGCGGTGLVVAVRKSQESATVGLLIWVMEPSHLRAHGLAKGPQS